MDVIDIADVRAACHPRVGNRFGDLLLFAPEDRVLCAAFSRPEAKGRQLHKQEGQLLLVGVSGLPAASPAGDHIGKESAVAVGFFIVAFSLIPDDAAGRVPHDLGKHVFIQGAGLVGVPGADSHQLLHGNPREGIVRGVPRVGRLGREHLRPFAGAEGVFHGNGHDLFRLRTRDRREHEIFDRPIPIQIQPGDELVKIIHIIPYPIVVQQVAPLGPGAGTGAAPVAAEDPYGNAQMLSELFGEIYRDSGKVSGIFRKIGQPPVPGVPCLVAALPL